MSRGIDRLLEVLPDRRLGVAALWAWKQRRSIRFGLDQLPLDKFANTDDFGNRGYLDMDAVLRDDPFERNRPENQRGAEKRGQSCRALLQRLQE